MQSLADLVKHVLDMSPRHGWILFLIGLAMLVLLRLEVIPPTELGAGWIVLIWLIFVSGASILLVSLGSWLYVAHTSRSKGRREEQEKLDKEKALAETGLHNARHLDRYYASQLLSVLVKGERCFIPDFDASSLRSLHILKARDHRSPIMYEVVEPVWEEREKLIRLLRERKQR